LHREPPAKSHQFNLIRGVPKQGVEFRADSAELREEGRPSARGAEISAGPEISRSCRVPTTYEGQYQRRSG